MKSKDIFLIRTMFLASGILMLITLPFLYARIPSPLLVSVFIILGIGLLAGLTRPGSRGILAFNTLISGIALVIFEYFAVTAYYGNDGTFFLVNQVLAFLFFFSLYFASKSIYSRGIGSEDEDE